VLIAVLHASDVEVRSGWFVESLATQTLVIFVIRTRRVPWWRSRASRALTTTTLACTATAIVLPYSPLAGPLGFTALSVGFLAILVVLVVCYLTAVEVAKAWFFRPPAPSRRIVTQLPTRQRRTHRRAARFSTG
jgi:Mg2+-importing ATPase